MRWPTLDVDDVLRQAQLAHHDHSDGRKDLVDLDGFDVAETPADARERLLYRRDRTEAEYPWLDGGDAVGDETRFTVIAGTDAGNPALIAAGVPASSWRPPERHCP